MITDWDSLRRQEAAEEYWEELQEFVAAERSGDPGVYPAEDEVFAALDMVPYANVKVVILGQDPYPGRGRAHGLAFSVKRGVPVPYSLRNIYRELESDDVDFVPPSHGFLGSWAEQGVLLLNTLLTVRAGKAGSHRGRGWERFTDQVIRAVAAKDQPVVFMLWGRRAQRKRHLITEPRHLVIETAHPAARPAGKGFRGTRPFSRANAFLTGHERGPVDWQLREL